MKKIHNPQRNILIYEVTPNSETEYEEDYYSGGWGSDDRHEGNINYLRRPFKGKGFVIDNETNTYELLRTQEDVANAIDKYKTKRSLMPIKRDKDGNESSFKVEQKTRPPRVETKEEKNERLDREYAEEQSMRRNK